MFLSRRVRCSPKYVCGQVYNNYNLNSSRFLKNLVNKDQYSPTARLTCLYNLQISQISTFPPLAKDPSIKYWKHSVRYGTVSDELPHEACEEGKDAVPHAVLVSELQKCPTVASQIELFCFLVSLTPEDIEIRRAYCQSLEKALSIYFHPFRITLFGSSVNGLGFKGCDMDVCFHTFNNETNKDYVLLRETPSLQSVLDGTVSQKSLGCMTPKCTLHFISRILRQHCPDVNKEILHITARCPILKFYDKKLDLFSDFSCESKNSVRNTMLLWFLCHLDNRFTTIAKIVRYWGKYGGFVGDLEKFNCYSFSLLVVHFLQTRNPPVLPAIQDLKDSEYLQNGTIDDIDLMLKDLKAFPPSQNTQTVEELLKEFYFYFLTFDFSRVMLLYSSSSVSKENFVPDKTSEDVFEFGSVNIQDPFRHSFNVAHGATFKNCKQFMLSILKTCDAYQNEFLWTPETENWGLCSLFHEPIKVGMALNEWNEKLYHSIDLPLISDGPEKLKNLLQHGLLFHCTELHTDDAGIEPGSQIHFKLNCKAYHKTWQGRDFVENLQLTNNCILERENFISKELVKLSESKREILCEFQCKCVEVVINGKSSLVLNLNFVKSKYPIAIVVIFLKKFIPDIFRKL